MFGIRPVGFNSFEGSPQLPVGWNQMALRNIHSFAHVFDLEVSRASGGKLAITIKKDGREKKYIIKEGATQLIQL
jgi:hypothetical protein